MPHAVLLGASQAPEFSRAPLARTGDTIHKTAEVFEGPQGWLVKSLILERGEPTKFFTRIDRRDDGMVVRLDDHMHIERTAAVFDHLAHIALLVLAANPGASVGPTNLQEQMAKAEKGG